MNIKFEKKQKELIPLRKVIFGSCFLFCNNYYILSEVNRTEDDELFGLDIANGRMVKIHRDELVTPLKAHIAIED